MSVTDPQPRKRGRPVSGTARTATQRTRAFRERAKTAVFAPAEQLDSVPITGLVEAFGQAVKARMPIEVERIAVELLRRMGHTMAVSETAIPAPVLEPKGTRKLGSKEAMNPPPGERL
ncbi:MAG: hypothetical protein ACOYB3_05550 [Azonexus sp.]